MVIKDLIDHSHWLFCCWCYWFKLRSGRLLITCGQMRVKIQQWNLEY